MTRMKQIHADQTNDPVCEQCGTQPARHYEQYSFSEPGAPAEEIHAWLCVPCARAARQAIDELQRAQVKPPGAYSRDELMAEIDCLLETSGGFEICRRCHEQKTGCCPPQCRALGTHGCQQKNVFCSGFMCSALLNAYAECDAETGRRLKWLKTNYGAAEFRVYEMMTRVPQADREEARPLALPIFYPGPLELPDGAPLRAKLLGLAEEVLEIRRRWDGPERGAMDDLSLLNSELSPRIFHLPQK